MTTITFKIPERLNARLEAQARDRHVSKSTIVRQALEKNLPGKHATRRVKAWGLAGHLAGSVKGPPDLLTNPKHMGDFGA
ncbi:MAG: ribbon-helix-helix protein, CopG family [Anaerolineae bacterium]|nr:ribbon-helix-helix protein, CopG family [Phycisphaerae bacterium]